MTFDKDELQKIVNLPDDILDLAAETTWGKTHAKQNLSYEEVKNIQVNQITKMPSTSLKVGDIFSFLNPETTNPEETTYYRVKRSEDYQCLIFKIN